MYNKLVEQLKKEIVQGVFSHTEYHQCQNTLKYYIIILYYFTAAVSHF